MAITPRILAIQGVGYSSLVLATQGVISGVVPFQYTLDEDRTVFVTYEGRILEIPFNTRYDIIEQELRILLTLPEDRHLDIFLEERFSDILTAYRFDTIVKEQRVDGVVLENRENTVEQELRTNLIADEQRVETVINENRLITA